MKYNNFYALLLLAYGIPGLYMASGVPFLNAFLGGINVALFVTAVILQATIAWLLLPRINFLGRNEEISDYVGNILGVNLIKGIFVISCVFVLYIEFFKLIQNIGSGDRNSLYVEYRALNEIYHLDKIKTLIAVLSIYLSISSNVRLALGFCAVISIVDFGFGNRGFMFYTFLIFVFHFFPQFSTMKNKRLTLAVIFSFISLMLLRTYIFSGDAEISGDEHFLAVFGEFVFTSSAPLFVHELGVQGNFSEMLFQFLGMDKITGERAMWVGEIIQKDLNIPIGLACGPLCEIYYYVPNQLFMLASASGIVVMYAAFIRLSIAFFPMAKRMPIVLVQILLMRDVIRTGLVISFSTLVLWTVIAIILNKVFFGQKKNDPLRSTKT